MIDKSIKIRKIDLILKDLDYLKSINHTSKENFLNNYERILATRHAVQECIQICLDIAFHLCAINEFETPKNYRDAFHILGKNGLISTKTAEKMELWAGLRNIITHTYEEIDDSLLWKAITTDLNEIKVFVNEIGKLKEK
jgi:uncharacterized protein YutE (UPF0331/DUF86 family)